MICITVNPKNIDRKHKTPIRTIYPRLVVTKRHGGQKNIRDDWEHMVPVSERSSYRNTLVRRPTHKPSPRIE